MKKLRATLRLSWKKSVAHKESVYFYETDSIEIVWQGCKYPSLCIYLFISNRSRTTAREQSKNVEAVTGGVL